MMLYSPIFLRGIFSSLENTGPGLLEFTPNNFLTIYNDDIAY